MRSRYSAYVVQDEAYLLSSWHPQTRPEQITFDPDIRWLGLKVYSAQGGGEDQEGSVTFAARYKIAGRGHRLEERSRFLKVGEQWLYLDGETNR